MSAEKNLSKLNINLPKAPDPVGSYVASKIVGNLIYISGQVSFNLKGELTKGKIGKELSLDQGQDAAKLCALNILAQLKKKCGNLDKVKGLIDGMEYKKLSDLYIPGPIVDNAGEFIRMILPLLKKRPSAAGAGAPFLFPNVKFFISFEEASFLNGQYTVFGKVVEGMEYIDKVMRGEPPDYPDKIVSMKLSD